MTHSKNSAIFQVLEEFSLWVKISGGKNLENEYRDIRNHAMIVLENVRKNGERDGMGKLKFEHNTPLHIINFLKNNGFIFFKKVDGKFIDNQVVLITEKGIKELEETFEYK